MSIILSPILWWKKLNPKKVSKLAKVTQLHGSSVKILTQVCPIPPHAGDPTPSTKPRRQGRVLPPPPSQCWLGSLQPHSGSSLRRHA